MERYAVLWVPADAATRDAQLYVGEPEKAHRAKYQPLQKAGLVPRTLSAFAYAGTITYSAVWWKPARPLTDLEFNFGLDEGNYERTLSPSVLQTDVRLATNPGRLDQARREFLALLGMAPAPGLAAAPWLALAVQRADEQPLNRDYATVSHTNPDFVSEEVHGLEPIAHRQRVLVWKSCTIQP